jgi:hypothetical protein
MESQIMTGLQENERQTLALLNDIFPQKALLNVGDMAKLLGYKRHTSFYYAISEKNPSRLPYRPVKNVAGKYMFNKIEVARILAKGE